jgi:ABC-type lipoprotein release transport system permease subunit
MRKFLEIARTGVASIWLHPLRAAVTIACVTATLTPFLVGFGIAQGIERQARDSIREGADLTVTATEFGRAVPIPLDAVPRIAELDGVLEVVPRIVGHVSLGKDQVPAVIVGMAPEKVPAAADCVEGKLFGPGPSLEFVVGSELARQLQLRVGSRIPPFYHSDKGDRVATVVGVFKSDAPLWGANLIFTSLQSASDIFDQPGRATDFLVYCRPGYEESVARAIPGAMSSRARGSAGSVRCRVVARGDAYSMVTRGFGHRTGVFQLHFVLAFAIGIAVVLVTSGIGIAERRREIGILKATGWQTDEVLLRGMVESVLLSVMSVCLSVLLAFVWLRVGNGVGVASVFLTRVDSAVAFRVPFQLVPTAILVGLVIAFCVIATGTLFSAWRSAASSPADAMR